MGIVNVTPDSFSGDGLGTDHDAAVAQGLRMVAEAPTCSTSAASRLGPAICRSPRRTRSLAPAPSCRRLAREAGVPVSIDTYKLEVAEAAVEAGAAILNDVWGLTAVAGAWRTWRRATGARSS